jgi:hypothetical protein
MRVLVGALPLASYGSQNRSAEVDKIRMSGLREKVDHIRLFYMMEIAEELTRQAHTINHMKAHFKHLKTQLKHSFETLSAAAADPIVCSVCAARLSKPTVSSNVVTFEATAASPCETTPASRSAMVRVRSANTVNRLAEVDTWLKDDQHLDIEHDDGTRCVWLGLFARHVFSQCLLAVSMVDTCLSV